MTDDDYGDYYDYEPTEEERLAVYIADDACPDDDTNELMYRQQERWAEFQQSVQDSLDRSNAKFDAANKPQRYGPGTWWRLWVPPEGIANLRTGSAEDGHVMKLGDLSVTHEQEFDNIRSRYELASTRILVGSRVYLDFYPNDRDVLDLLFREQRVITQGMVIHSDWGWWDEPHGRLRSIVQEARMNCDPEHLELGYTGLDIQCRTPPPYGVWLPALHDMKD